MGTKESRPEMHGSRAGRVMGRTPQVNVLRDGAKHAAEAVKFRLLARNTTLDVTVDEAGFLRTDAAFGDIERPDAWRVGRFTRSVTLADIEDALDERIRELPQARLAA
jgi:hypothetical protein